MVRIGGRVTSAVSPVSGEAACTDVSGKAANKFLSSKAAIMLAFRLGGSGAQISPESGSSSIETNRGEPNDDPGEIFKSGRFPKSTNNNVHAVINANAAKIV